MQKIEIEAIAFSMISKDYVEETRKLILDGLQERFGFLDDSYNTDLKDIMKNYIDKGDIFLVGLIGNSVVCSGALTRESKDVARIERMSVQKEFRGQGLAKQMLFNLEKCAIEREYKKIVLETNSEWESAIQLYKRNGFNLDHKDSSCSHFYKNL